MSLLPISALDLDLSTVDTSFPSLAVGQVRVEIKKFDCQESKKTPGLYLLVITLATMQPEFDTKGKTLDPGFEFNTRLTLPGGPKVPSEKMSAEDMEDLRQKQLAMFIDAVLHTELGSRPALTDSLLDSMIGKQVLVNVKKAEQSQVDQGFAETEVKGFKQLPQG